jgi:ketosteroid isomerase-like protein
MICIAPSSADPASAKRDIQAVYNRIAAAMKKKDIDAIAATGAPNFKTTAGTRTMNAEQSLNVVKQFMAAVKEFKTVTMTVESIKLMGDSAAVVIMRSNVVAITNPQQGKTHTMVSKGSSRDHWVKTGKGWLLQSVEDIPGATTTVDGKPAK